MAKQIKETNHFVENNTPPDLVASPDLYEATKPVGVHDANQDSLPGRELRAIDAAAVAQDEKAKDEAERSGQKRDDVGTPAQDHANDVPRDIKGFVHELEELNRRTLVGRDMRPELHELIARFKKQL